MKIFFEWLLALLLIVTGLVSLYYGVIVGLAFDHNGKVPVDQFITGAFFAGICGCLIYPVRQCQNPVGRFLDRWLPGSYDKK